MNIYTRMIDIIEERGLSKDSQLVSSNGSCCLLGAIILDSDPEYTINDYVPGDYDRLAELPVVKEMADALQADWQEKVDRATIPVFRYSDTSSQKEVIDFLDRMAHREDSNCG